MFNWIYGMWKSVFGRISDTIRNWVTDLINGVYGFYHNIDALIRQAWLNLANAYYWLSRNMAAFANAVYGKLWQIARYTIPAVINEYRRLYNDVATFANNVYNRAAAWYNDALHYAEHLINGVMQWVITNVWDPLYKLTTDLFNWIKNKGEILWYYITHPDALAELLFSSLIGILEREAWQVGSLLGRFFLSLVVKNLPQFAGLIEDVLNAIL